MEEGEWRRVDRKRREKENRGGRERARTIYTSRPLSHKHMSIPRGRNSSSARSSRRPHSGQTPGRQNAALGPIVRHLHRTDCRALAMLVVSPIQFMGLRLNSHDYLRERGSIVALGA